MLRGDLYRADDPFLVGARRRCAELIARLDGTSADDEARKDLLGELLGSLGDGANIMPPFRCDYGSHIRIGARTFINYGTVALDSARITIGEDVKIGPNVQLLTATHPVDPAVRRDGLEYALPITVEDGAWLGGGAIVGPGVTIGRDSVIGAGSVVIRDVPAGVVAAGNPCRVVRTIGA